MRDIKEARNDFPGINRNINDHPLAYLDSGASSQLPNAVVNRVQRYQYYDHSNIHRGVHELSQRATEAYEETREDVRRFINASSTNEIIFTSGATEAISLVAQTLGKQRRGGHDKILITQLEHHSNADTLQYLMLLLQLSLYYVQLFEVNQFLIHLIFE